MNIAQQNSRPYDESELSVLRRESNIVSYGIIKTIMGSRIVESLPLRVRCECSMPSCEDIIEIILAKRRELRRSYPTGFIVANTHACSGDKLVFNLEEYCIVQKADHTEKVKDL